MSLSVFLFLSPCVYFSWNPCIAVFVTEISSFQSIISICFSLANLSRLYPDWFEKIRTAKIHMKCDFHWSQTHLEVVSNAIQIRFLQIHLSPDAQTAQIRFPSVLCDSHRDTQRQCHIQCDSVSEHLSRIHAAVARVMWRTTRRPVSTFGWGFFFFSVELCSVITPLINWIMLSFNLHSF